MKIQHPYDRQERKINTTVAFLTFMAAQMFNMTELYIVITCPLLAPRIFLYYSAEEINIFHSN